MSRNKNVNYAQYVHEFVDEHGVKRFAVAELVIPMGDPSISYYQRPLDIRMSKLTGNWAEFVKYVKDFGGYLTRKQALRRARYLFGGK